MTLKSAKISRIRNIFWIIQPFYWSWDHGKLNFWQKFSEWFTAFPESYKLSAPMRLGSPNCGKPWYPFTGKANMKYLIIPLLPVSAHSWHGCSAPNQQKQKFFGANVWNVMKYGHNIIFLDFQDTLHKH